MSGRGVGSSRSRQEASSKLCVEQWSSASFVECGDEDGKPCCQAGDDACLAGASRADDSSAQLKLEHDTGSVVEPGMDDSKDKATLSVTMVLPTIDALSDAEESDELAAGYKGHA